MTEKYFKPFRKQTIGIGQKFITPNGTHKIIYADWTASGRLYVPIEDRIVNEIGPFLANTHTETSTTGTLMTKAYHEARIVIKKHVNAHDDDALVFAGSGMTGAVNKLQRLLGIRLPNHADQYLCGNGQKIAIEPNDRPVVFITHMEHHSNQTSWLETIADVEIIPPTKDGLVMAENLIPLLKKYAGRKLKIASVTACSNVTGIETPYHAIAKLMHQAGGYCFVDFACSAPYVHINMHPEQEDEHLDAIFFSPHKFLGGPGTSGVLIFNASLYNNPVPDNPGGGTVVYTNPWKTHKYSADIETREDGGTPPFLQAIRTALAIRLKEEMGIDNILKREHELVERLLSQLKSIPNLHVLAGEHTQRLGVVSFIVKDLHYNLMVRLLNDYFGIQARGGCACAGTYGHFLLDVDPDKSRGIMNEILSGDKSHLPGWCRVSIHPILKDKEIDFIAHAIKMICENHSRWKLQYDYDPKTNEFTPKNKDFPAFLEIIVESWFSEI